MNPAHIESTVDYFPAHIFVVFLVPLTSFFAFLKQRLVIFFLVLPISFCNYIEEGIFILTFELLPGPLLWLSGGRFKFTMKSSMFI